MFQGEQQIMLLHEEYEKTLRALLIMLNPFCPHISAELYSRLHSISKLPETKNVSLNDVIWLNLFYFLSLKITTIFEETWPIIDPNYKEEVSCQVCLLSILK